jgi:hypothetical protein
MKKATVDSRGSAMLKRTGIVVAMLFLLLPAFAKDSSTANAVKEDESSKTIGTKVKSYEEKTNTRRSLRSAADQMQQAAQKDRTQTSPRKTAAATSTTKTTHKPKTTLH